MTPFVDLVVVHGPWLLFVLAVLETCFVTGLVVPSGMATAAATAIVGGSGLALVPIALAAGSGALTGDLLGYAIGRWSGERLRAGDGWIGRTLRRHERDAGRWLGRHPIYSVTVARWVSFVRTLMPMSAGIARLPVPVFVTFVVPGVLGWLALYMGIGVLAGESWQRVGTIVGGGWTVVFVLVGAVWYLRWRRRRGAGSRTVSEGGDAC